MSEMIEKLAKAICDGHTSGNADFDEVPEIYRVNYRDAARAALKAMSYPTDEMIDNAESLLIGTNAPRYVSLSIFKTMIETALEESK